ncbi:hypothetical protein FB639_006076, partial [Coemansia asiatica]
MKILLAHTILFTAALASAASADASPDFHQELGIQKRQGLFDNLQSSFNDAINNAGNLFDIGHAGEDSATGNDNNADTPAPQASTSPTKSSSSASTKSSSATSKKTPSSSTPTSSSSGKDNSTDNNTDNEQTTTDEETATEDNTTKGAKPTGEPCSNDGEKQCVSSGSSGAYKLCQDGFWINQKCGGSNVCGTDSQGSIACIDKNKPVVQLESCSKKNQQRCDANDGTKYQICDGKHWQSYGCDDNKQCAISNNKAVCGSTDGGSGSGGDSGSYSPITQMAFVPESSANGRAAVAGSAMALVLAA